MATDDALRDALAGRKLWGDDFSNEQLREWFRDEEEAYAGVWAEHWAANDYPFHALNWVHGFRSLPIRRFAHVCSLGGADGQELIPIARSIERVTLVEPSQSFTATGLDGIPTTYVHPDPLGTLPLIVSFGTLHHIANVSKVLGEMTRCLTRGGYMLLREPIVSMGDWRHPRGLLTKRERGIPLPIFREIIAANGLLVRRETRCMFALTQKLKPLFDGAVYNSRLVVRLDRALCSQIGENHPYHAMSAWRKLRPTCVFYVLQKPVSPMCGDTARMAVRSRRRASPG